MNAFVYGLLGGLAAIAVHELYEWRKRKRNPIVHCHDCKRMREWTADELAGYDEAEFADGWCMFFRIGTYDDFFCAWGERSEDE